ncbi:DUF418 domain-containing protein [Aquibacillus kalidii]|uniref:DUF418 domain-containing protein n=1 Tax=Aquibacillus kalidii TaxID=2762597 RepID=UPI001647AAEE|nr:DUF418 domain-containing protein [Aquibacillus kalidii]
MKTRITVVDRLRGISLFGILAANMLIFQYGIYGKDEMSHYSLLKIDEITHLVLKIVIESSFMPIFAFLFGYGIIKMQENLKHKQLPVKRYLARRFLLLFIIGILHSTFLWEGDILTSYGLTGFLLLLFLNRKAKTLLVWAIVMLTLSGLLGYGSSAEVATTAEEKEIMSEYVTSTIDIYRNGSFSEIMSHRMNEDPLTEMLPGGAILLVLLLSPIMLLPMFLFGIIAAKQQWFLNIDNYQNRWKKLATGFVISGILLKMMPYLFPDLGLSGIGYTLGGPLLAFGYIFLFSLLLNNQNNILAKGFEAIGRLSLTNYLFQTIVCILIFYGFGLGLFGKLGVLWGVGLTIVIFSAQMVTSLLYLKTFRIGPFEKILRMWTYFTWSGRIKTANNVKDFDLRQIK